MNNKEPFLPPVENPRGLMMKLAYRLSRRQYGKVMTPMKVFAARMPAAFGRMGATIYRLDEQLGLPRELVFLVRQQVARTNICDFCMDIGRYRAMQEAMDEDKFYAMDDYRSSKLFSAAEKAALDYAGELTRYRKVSPETFARLAAFFSERQICGIVYLVASEHLSNITNIGLNIHSDLFCDIRRRTTAPEKGQDQAG